MWFDRFGPHERRVMCWFAYDLHVELMGMHGNNSRLEERLERHKSNEGTPKAQRLKKLKIALRD